MCQDFLNARIFTKHKINLIWPESRLSVCFEDNELYNPLMPGDKKKVKRTSKNLQTLNTAVLIRNTFSSIFFTSTPTKHQNIFLKVLS